MWDWVRGAMSANSSPVRRIVPLVAAVIVTLAACGGSSDLGESAATTTTAGAAPTTSDPVSTTAVAAPSDTACPEGEATPADPGTYCLGPAALTAEAVQSTESRFDGVGHSIALTLTAEETDEFNALAAVCFNRIIDCPTGQIAIVSAGRVLSAPTVQTTEFGNTVAISGNFTADEAATLAIDLRSDVTFHPVLLQLP